MELVTIIERETGRRIPIGFFDRENGVVAGYDGLKKIDEESYKSLALRDKYLGFLDSHGASNGADGLADATSDILFGRSLGATLEESIEYASAGAGIGAGNGADAQNDYDFGVALARAIGISMPCSIKIGRVLSENNIADAGYLIAKEKGLRKDENAREFGRIYGIAVQKYGLEDATLNFVPLYFETLRTASGLNIKVNLNNIAFHVDPCVEIIKDPKYHRNLDSLAGNALYAARNGIAINPEESWKFAKSSIDEARRGGDVKRWTKAVCLLRKQYGKDLSDSMEIASYFESNFLTTGIYPAINVFMLPELTENNTIRKLG